MIIKSKNRQKAIKQASLVVFLLLITTAFLFFGRSFAIFLWITLGSLFVLFLPGFLLTFIFFPKTRMFYGKPEEEEKNKIDLFERIILAVFFSVTFSTIILTVINNLGGTLTPFVVSVSIITFTAITAFWFLFVVLRRKNR